MVPSVVPPCQLRCQLWCYTTRSDLHRFSLRLAKNGSEMVYLAPKCGTFVVRGSASETATARPSKQGVTCWANRPWVSGETLWFPMIHSMTVPVTNPTPLTRGTSRCAGRRDPHPVADRTRRRSRRRSNSCRWFTMSCEDWPPPRWPRRSQGRRSRPRRLVHEAYIRLVDMQRAQQWNGRGHFFAAAAEAMRRILVENARRKRSEKHGGGRAAPRFGEHRLGRSPSRRRSRGDRRGPGEAGENRRYGRQPS